MSHARPVSRRETSRICGSSFAGRFGSAREHNRVEFLAQRFYRHVVAHVRVSLKLHAFGDELFEAPVEDALLHLEIGNAVAQKPADAVGLLEKRGPVAGAIQLLRGRESRGP